MGRMGTAAYNAMENDYPDQIAGVEINQDRTGKQQDLGRHVVIGDATNPDFWSRAIGLLDNLEWVMLTLPNHTANMAAAERLQQMGYTGRIAATSKFPDEEQELRDIGVDLAFNIYTEAGIGFASGLKKMVD